MTPPNQIKCQVPGCKYKTPKGCPTWELMYKDRDDHMLYSHPKPADNSDPRIVVDQVHVQSDPHHVGENQNNIQNPSNQTLTTTSGTANLTTQTPFKEDKTQLSASRSPMTNILRNCGILPAEMSSSNSLSANSTSNHESINNPATDEEIAKVSMDDAQWSQLQFTAFVAKSTEADTKWRCSEGCMSGRNTDFWVSKQGVKKHISREHPDPRVSSFLCKICYVEKKKRRRKEKEFYSCDQVLEHFRLNHKTSGAMPSIEKQCESILACHSEDRTLHRVQKRSKETWVVDLGSTVVLQGGSTQFFYEIPVDNSTSQVSWTIGALEPDPSLPAPKGLLVLSSESGGTSEQPTQTGCDSQEPLVIHMQEQEPRLTLPDPTCKYLDKDQEAEDKEPNSSVDTIQTESNRQQRDMIDFEHDLHDQDLSRHSLPPSFQVPSSSYEANLKTTEHEHQGARTAKRCVEGKSPDKSLKRKCAQGNIPESYYGQKDRKGKDDANTQEQEQLPELNPEGSPSPPVTEQEKSVSTPANIEKHMHSHGDVERSDDCSREGYTEEDQAPIEDHQFEPTKDQKVTEAVFPARINEERDNDESYDNVTNADPRNYCPVPSGSIHKVPESEELSLSPETSNEDVNLEEELCEDTIIDGSCIISTNGKGGRGSYSKPKNKFKASQQRHRKSMKRATKDKLKTSYGGGRRTPGHSKITSKLFSYQHKNKQINTSAAETDNTSESGTDYDTDEDMTTDGKENEDDSYKVVEYIRSIKRKGKTDLKTPLQEFQYYGVTYKGASYIHWLVLQKDMTRLLEGQSQLSSSCLSLTCLRRRKNQPWTEVTSLMMAFEVDSLWKGDMGKLLLGSAPLLQELPQFQHGGSTYCSARLVHWLVLQEDVVGLRERQQELRQAKDLTCKRTDRDGDTQEVTAVSLALHMDGEGNCSGGQTNMVVLLLGSSSMLQKLPQFQHDGSTYYGARLIHWMVLKRDVAGVGVRQEELGQCRDLTCSRTDRGGDTQEVTAVSLALHMDGEGNGWEGRTDMVVLLLGSSSMLQKLPQFQHGGFTYCGARLIHWLVLQGDLSGVRERQEELGQCRELTCSRHDEMGDSKKVTSFYLACTLSGDDGIKSWPNDEMVKLLLGSASLLQDLPQFQYDSFTYHGACLMHWMVLQEDVVGLRERQEELRQARDLTCKRADRDGDTQEVTSLMMAFEVDSIWKGDMGKLLLGSAPLPQELPQFQHDKSTYLGARLVHWMVLKRDVVGVRERQEELAQCGDLTCTVQDETGDSKKVTAFYLACTLSGDDGSTSWPKDEMVNLLLGSVSLLQELPQFQHDNVTYLGARLVHWMVAQGDVAGLRERQEELGHARDLTCTRQWSGNTWTNVTPLYLACLKKQESLARLLLEAGADTNIAAHVELSDGSVVTQSPLCLAAGQGLESICSLLLDRGAWLDLGESPLHIAAWEGEVAVCRLLLDRGADIDMLEDEETPLYWAAETGRESVCSLLLDRGARLDLGKSPLGITGLSQGIRNMIEEQRSKRDLIPK